MPIAYKIEKVIEVPEGATVTVKNKTVSATGPKGSLQRGFKARNVSIKTKDSTVVVFAKDVRKRDKAMIGTVSSHIKNMLVGVTKGFECHMKVFYTHFPISVSIKEKEFVISNFLGEKYPRKSKIVGDAKAEVKGQDITITGTNKEEVGQTAANLVLATGIGNRDPRVFKDGIFLAKKGVSE